MDMTSADISSLSETATQTILSKIPPNDSKLTFAAESLLFHYIKANGLVAMVVAADEAGRRMPFAFLAELHKRFGAAYSEAETTDAPAYRMNGFEADLSKLMVSSRSFVDAEMRRLTCFPITETLRDRLHFDRPYQGGPG